MGNNKSISQKQLKKELSKKELSSLSKELDKLELEAYIPYKHLSGGFAETEVYSIDEDEVLIELKFGVQDGNSSVVYKEGYSWNRETMKLEELN